MQLYTLYSHNIFCSYRILHCYHRLIHSNRPRLFGTWSVRRQAASGLASTGAGGPTPDISKKQIESWNSWKVNEHMKTQWTYETNLTYLLNSLKTYLKHGNPWDFPLKIWVPGTFKKGLCAWSYSVRWKWSHGWSEACDEANGGLSRWNLFDIWLICFWIPDFLRCS